MTDDRRPEAGDAWAAYRRLRLLVDARVARDLEESSGLSMADYEVLAGVVAISAEGACVRVRALADRMHWSHSRLSRQLGRMGQRGLIAREPCELDGRGDDIELTTAGRQVYEDATPGHLTSIQRHFTGLLSAQQLAVLSSIEQTVRASR